MASALVAKVASRPWSWTSPISLSGCPRESAITLRCWPTRTATGAHVAAGSYSGAVKGDRVEVLIDVGAGVERFEIEATRAGRRVEVSNVRGTVEVTEVTRSGTPVRTARFMAAKVVAVVEHPARDGEAPVRSGSDTRHGAP